MPDMNAVSFLDLKDKLEITKNWRRGVLGIIDVTAGFCVFSYLFEGGKAQNSDGTYVGQVVNCTPRQVSVSDPVWGSMNSGMEFRPGGSTIRVPMSGRLNSALSFAIEMLIFPEEMTEDRVNLMEGQAIPFAFMLTRKNGAYYLSGSVNSNGVWQAIDADSGPIQPKVWSSVSMVFTGDDIVLVQDGSVVARRVLKNALLSPTGTGDYFIGTWIDGKQYQFVGKMTCIRFWDTMPGSTLTAIEDAEAAGVGEIDSKYLDLGGNAGPSGVPVSDERNLLNGRDLVGRIRSFQNGKIYWSGDTGAHEVHGIILSRYESLGGPQV